jgi:hypothetical protein
MPHDVTLMLSGALAATWRPHASLRRRGRQPGWRQGRLGTGSTGAAAAEHTFAIGLPPDATAGMLFLAGGWEGAVSAHSGSSPPPRFPA